MKHILQRTLDVHFMNLRMVTAVFILATSSAASATTYQCDDPSLDNRLQELYAYTLFVEGAETGMLPAWSCMDDNGSPVMRPLGWDRESDNGRTVFQPLSRDELNALDWNRTAESFREQGLHVGAYVREGSEQIYVVCDDNPVDVILFLTWTRIRSNIDNATIRPFNLVFSLHAVDFAVSATTKEGLQSVTFRRDDSLSGPDQDFYPDTVTAVPGTNFTSPPEWGTSVTDLHERSCLFDFMLAMARNILAGNNEPYAFAGHSLGGSVAQYVAQQLALPLERFQAYAFNGIGIDVCRGINPMNLQSFYVAGDPVVNIGEHAGRVQGGAILQYTPPEATGFLGHIEYWWEVLTFWWHRRPGVQQALCDCMNERGVLSITLPRDSG